MTESSWIFGDEARHPRALNRAPGCAAQLYACYSPAEAPLFTIALRFEALGISGVGLRE